MFAAPWEGRAFGLALDLVEQRGLSWDAFRELLIEAIADEPIVLTTSRGWWRSSVSLLSTIWSALPSSSTSGHT